MTTSVHRATGRLRAILTRYYPAALELFGGLKAQITLSFILEYSTPQAMAELSYEDLIEFARGRRYPKQWLRRQYVRMQRPQPKPSLETVQVYEAEARLLAQHCLELVRTSRALKKELYQLSKTHPDQEIFTSLPGAGELLAPSLLAKFGDHRERFPTANSVQALAGTCPVTDASGKRRVVKFRRACDLEFRQIMQQWARCSLRQSVWAQAYWEQVRPRSAHDNDAYRRLANRWLAIVWKLWQTRQPYDEAYHLQQRMLRSKPK